MTRDVKVGLLLGLGFIFMIAFVINGLPSLRGSRDSNELTRNMVEFPSRSPGIGARERKFINQAELNINEPYRAQDSLLRDPGIRYKVPLSEIPSFAKDNEATGLQASERMVPAPLRPVEERVTVIKAPKPVIPAFPKTYVVTDGDNLALIATKFYGEEEGNKRANIGKIFEANRNLLKTPDEIQVGQKLIIPSLSFSTAEKEKDKGGLASAIFEKVKSIGRERLPSKKPERTSRGKSYTVRDGDSLWKIAVDQLGDGSRYPEIVKLNDDVLSDEDSLMVGMSLKMPPK
jgi:nucleoid-associated protein YgaU